MDMNRASRALWVALALATIAALSLPNTAQAWWRGRFGFGFFPFAPFYYYPPPIYGPPLVYAPPYPAYPPPAYQGQDQSAGGPGQQGPACYAGAYVCPLSKPG